MATTESELAYWRHEAIIERSAKLEARSNYVVMALIALCEAGVIVALVYAKWRGAL